MTSASVDAAITTLKAADPEPPKRRRGGPPKGSKNAIRHGLTTTALPPGCTGVRKSVTTFRQALEKIVAQKNDGEISIYCAAVINSACRWEQHALLAVRWLRLQHEKMTHDQRLNFSREIAKASSERDKCLKELKLGPADVADRSKPDSLAGLSFDNIFNQPAAAPASPPAAAADPPSSPDAAG